MRDAITQRLEELEKEADKFSQHVPGSPSAIIEEPAEPDHFDEEPGDKQLVGKEEKYDFGEGVGPGDTVNVRYLNEPKTILKVTLSEQRNDPANGIVGIFEPLGEALLGSEEATRSTS